MSDNIYGFKLINGMELIGKLTSENDHVININDCMVLVVVPLPDGAKGGSLNFRPFSGLAAISDKHVGIPVTLARSVVLAKYRMLSDITREYCDATGSIVLANSIH